MSDFSRIVLLPLALLLPACATHRSLQAPVAAATPLRTIPFELGGTYLRDGDRITIDSVRGTAATFTEGNLYEISGSYTLASHDSARLSVYTTSSTASASTGSQGTAASVHYLNAQTVIVARGAGRYTVYLYMDGPGYPHLSFYPATERASSFASAYFGTGDSTLKTASWLDTPHP